MDSSNQYHYRARNKGGEIITGHVDAASMEAAEKVLADNGLAVLSIEVPKHWRDILNIRQKVSLRRKSFFTQQLSTMVNAGLPLPKVLNLLARTEQHPLLKQVIIQIQEDIETGYSFSTALSKHPKIFSRVFVNAVRAGEATGKLEVVLKELAETLNRDSAASSKLRSVMVYPVFIIVAMFVVGAVMMTRVVPVLASVFGEAKTELPLATRILIAISNFFSQYWWLVIVLFIGLLVGIRIYLQTERGRYVLDSLKLRIYIIKDIAQMFYMTRFSRTLGMLIGAGVPLLEAIQITSDAMDNVLYKDVLEHAVVQVERGVALSLTLSKTPLFPPLVSQMILVGEQTGELDQVLNKLSLSYEDEYENIIKSATTLVEPIIIVILGVGVAFLVFAILIPIYQVSLLQ